jgi:surfactin family lipopeptide synthetase A
LSGRVLDEQVAYWSEALRGAPAVLELPSDRARPPVQSFRGATQTFTLPEDVAKALRALSQQEGATLFMTLLAAFKVLLYRYTGQNDIVVGSPIANRSQAELEDLIGFFINTLVLRTDLGGEPTFRELVGRVRQVALGAYAHQDLPFEKLVEELQPERDLSRNPLFQIMFSFQSIAASESQGAGAQQVLSTAASDLPQHGTAKFDMVMSLGDTGQEISGACEYNTDLFNDDTISRFLRHFQSLLSDIVRDPDRPVSTLRLLTEAERQQMLVEWNATRFDYLEDACVHQLFEAQVGRTPDALAVTLDQEQLSYRELNSRANQLAHHLKGLGIGPEARVGVCLDRSTEMVVGLLGILKAGGAYVPLDPAYPEERLSFMLENAGASVLLTQRRLVASLPNAESDLRIVCLDTDWKSIAREQTDNLRASVMPDNPAYVIYTSGSTGRPKGVAMTHRALCNLLSWHQAHPNLSAAAKTLQFASLNFDISFQDIFTTLCTGGTLVLVSEEIRRDVRELLRYVAQQGIERLFLPPVVLQQMAEVATDKGAALKNVRQVLAAGEQLHITPPIVNLFNGLEGCTLHNHYGPTETHLATEFILSGSPENWMSRPPIGRAIGNATLYVLDRRHQPVPVGVGGELYLGGVNLARGYLARPDLTAEKFIPHPFSAQPGARLYRTGDRARYLADGAVEYLGRADHQVKLRGFRIEPGEVETALCEHESVCESVVVVRGAGAGARLVAYVVVGGGGARAAGEVAGAGGGESEGAGEGARREGMVGEWRAHLRRRLPDYMVPSSFVVLERLPLTANGKVDRRALPEAGVGVEAEGAEASYVAPRTPVEAVVAQVWAEVLGVERVGVETNFFELGGHSLMATQVVSRVRDLFGVEVAVRAIFEAPTVAGLSERMIEDSAIRAQVEKAAELMLNLSRLSDDEVEEMVKRSDSSSNESETK